MHVLDNDNTNNPDGVETLTIVSVDTTGTMGSVVINGTNTDVTYQPPAGFQGSTTFDYTVHDPGGLPGTATVLVDVGADTIAPVGTAPVESIRTGVSIGATTVPVRITWSATDVGVGVTRYLLQRSVDGGAYATVTLPTAGTTAVNQSLTVGHTYQYRMRPYDGAGNPGTLKYGPLFRVSKVEQSSSLVTYAGAVWPTVIDAGDSGGSARYTYAGNATVTLRLSGRDFAFVAPVNSFRGSAWVYVDGQFVTSITEKTGSATTTYRRLLFSVHFSTYGTHIIQIRVSGNGRIDADAFVALR
jgi:Big-like domain-containing protein